MRRLSYDRTLHVVVVVVSGGGGGGRRTYYLTASSVYVKFVGYNLKGLHRRHICSCWLINSISYKIYMNMYILPSYRMSYPELQWFISYRCPTDIWMKLPHARFEAFTAVKIQTEVF